MDNINLRKIIEDRIFNLTGDSFQDFCDSFCLKLFPNDYNPIRAGGNKGDMKNDGYCPKQRIFFQAHATRGEEISVTKNKIDKDLSGCIANHPNLKQWVYLTNDTLVGEIHAFVDQIITKHPNIIIETWDHKIIADKIESLPIPKDSIEKILGIKLNSGSHTQIFNNNARIIQHTGNSLNQTNTQNNYYMESQVKEDYDLNIIDEIFSDVLKNLDKPAKYEDKESIELNKKIQLNFKNETDRETVESYFIYALTKVKLVENRMQLEDTETQKDIHSHIFTKYMLLKRKNLSNIEILEALFTEFIPKGKAYDPQYTNLTRAFVLSFFDDCTIFKKTETEKIHQDKLFEE